MITEIVTTAVALTGPECAAEGVLPCDGSAIPETCGELIRRLGSDVTPNLHKKGKDKDKEQHVYIRFKRSPASHEPIVS